MTGTAHPASVVYGSGNVSKAAVIADDKLKQRRVGTADDVRNGDWSGQYGPLFVAALDAQFKVDTSDTTTSDDGANCIIDANGLRFKRITADTTEAEVVITATGDVTIADDDTRTIFAINNTAAADITVYLPDAAGWSGQIAIFDDAGNAGTYTITVAPKAASGQTIMTGTNVVINTNGGGVRLTAKASGAGWR